MKILLTGGTGFVGSQLRDYLRRDGHEVRLLVRKESAGKIGDLAKSGEFEIVYGDVMETNTCLHACSGRDTVVHLVGIIREHPSRGITFDEMHRVATGNLVNAAKRSGVWRFVHMSALGARDGAASEYHRTKRAAERVVESSGLQYTIFRPGWIFAPGDEMSAMIKDMVRKPVIPLIDGGRAQLQPIAAEDVCHCIAKSLRMPETQGRTYEMGGPDRLTYREVFEQAALLSGNKPKTVSLSGGLLRPVVKALERCESFPLTTDQLKMLREDNVCEIDAYVKTFGVQPASFRQALPAMFG